MKPKKIIRLAEQSTKGNAIFAKILKSIDELVGPAMHIRRLYATSTVWIRLVVNIVT